MLKGGTYSLKPGEEGGGGGGGGGEEGSKNNFPIL